MIERLNASRSLVSGNAPSKLLSIFTPVLNRRESICAALASVTHTETGEVQHLVVDGGSQDGTREIVMTHRAAELIDAPGSTLYRAINLGVRRARGVWIALLNSDDEFEPGAMERVLPLLQRSRADAVRGLGCYRWSGPNEGKQLVRPAPSALTLETILFGGPAINALIIRRAALDRIGAFDETFKIAADREWLLRAYGAGWNIEQSGLPFYVYTLHPGSLTLNQRAGTHSRWTYEHVMIARQYLDRWPRFSHTGRSVVRWHAHETALLALQAFAQRQPRAALLVLRQGLVLDPLLPLSVVSAAVAGVRRRLTRKRVRNDQHAWP
jgi:glycosyltransferase involved in cell wall biosynthesis